MGKKTRFNVKPKWLFLFLSLFACALGVTGGVLGSEETATPVAAAANGDVFTRISAVGDLTDGDEVIFVNQAETYACGTTQNTNNRTPVSISVSSHTYTYNSSHNVQVFTVKKNGANFGFHTGSGYIYSASSTQNHLKTNSTAASTAPSGNYAWTLSASSYVFTAQNVSNTSYYLAFNGTSYFSQYANGQSKPYIFKKTALTPVSVTGVSLNKESTSIATGGTETLTATVSPAAATNKNVTWSSSDANVATVASGVVTAVAAGSAVITVTTEDGGFTDTCSVTVTEPHAGEYAEVLSTSSLQDGYKVIITSAITSGTPNTTNAMGAQSETIRSPVPGTTVFGSSSPYTIDDDTDIAIFTLIADDGNWRFFEESTSKYLAWESGNAISSLTDGTENNSLWKISFDVSGNLLIKNYSDDSRILQYNSGSPRFACYTSSQQKPRMFIKAGYSFTVKEAGDASTNYLNSAFNGNPGGTYSFGVVGTNFTAALVEVSCDDAAFTTTSPTDTTFTVLLSSAKSVKVNIFVVGTESEEATGSFTFKATAASLSVAKATDVDLWPGYTNASFFTLTSDLVKTIASSELVSVSPAGITVTKSNTTTYSISIPANVESGDFTITFRATDASGASATGSAVVSVFKPVDVESVTISTPSSLYYKVGAKYTLTAEVAGEGGETPTDPSLTWSSSDSTKVSVNTDTGAITAVAVGSATITATSNYDGSKSDSITLYVYNLTFSSGAATWNPAMGTTSTYRLNADGFGGSVSYSYTVSGSTSSISVSGSGPEYTVTAQRTPGTATIQFEASSASVPSETITATINVAAPQVSLSPSSLSFVTADDDNKTVSVSLTRFSPSGEKTYDITFSTPGIATFARAGQTITVTPLAIGSTRMTVSVTDVLSNTASAYCDISVTAAPTSGSIASTDSGSFWVDEDDDTVDTTFNKSSSGFETATGTFYDSASAVECGIGYTNARNIIPSKVIILKNGTLYNTSSLLGRLTSLSVTLGSDTSTSGRLYLSVGSSPIDTAKTEDTDTASLYTTVELEFTKGGTVSVPSSVFEDHPEFRYFQVASTTTNWVQIDHIDFDYIPDPPHLTKIELDTSLAKTIYIVNESFDLTGLGVTATYSDRSTASIDVAECEYALSSSMSTTGEKTVTITYSEDEYTKSATYTIRVLPTVTSVTLNCADTFAYGSAFTFTLDVHCSDDSEDTIDGELSMLSSGGDTSVLGLQNLVGSFGGKSFSKNNIRITNAGSVDSRTLTPASDSGSSWDGFSGNTETYTSAVKFDGVDRHYSSTSVFAPGTMMSNLSVSVVLYGNAASGSSGQDSFEVAALDKHGLTVDSMDKVIGSSAEHTETYDLSFDGNTEIVGLKFTHTGKKSFNIGVKSFTATPTMTIFSPSQQATGFKNYLARFNTCSYLDFAVGDPDTVTQLALEWNNLPSAAKSAASTMTLIDYAYRDGVDYGDGHYEYTSDDVKADMVTVWEKLKAIVALYNVKNPENPIYLVQNGDAVNSVGEDSGGIAYDVPFSAAHIPSYPRGEQSPLTMTLWIVLGTGFAGLVAIGAAYWASKRKKQRIQ